MKIDAATLTEIQNHLAEKQTPSPKQILNEIKHLNKSLQNTNESILVKPPECKKCGYNNFTNTANNPSQCPNCKSEWITEPQFKLVTD
jgi:predicted Zn-ribbon and HTH transcriptional regulator